MGPPSRPALSLDRQGRQHQAVWRPFFLISRTIVGRSQLLALASEDAEDAAVLRVCHADEKLSFAATMAAVDNLSPPINRPRIRMEHGRQLEKKPAGRLMSACSLNTVAVLCRLAGI